MENFIKTGRVFYGIGIICLAAQQFIYSDFRPVFLAPWPQWMHTPVWAYTFGVILTVAGLLIATSRYGFEVSAIFGILLILLDVLQAFYFLFIGPNSPKHLGLWTDPLKELAISGGAFAMAGSFFFTSNTVPVKATRFSDPVKLLLTGKTLFSIMLIAFGIAHFYYTDFVATLVPPWIPGQIFWTYIGGILLIGAGMMILFGIKLKLFAALTALMIFVWLFVLHIPRAIVDPYGANGNEITSCFEALAFSGIALVIAFTAEKTFNAIKTVLA
jgi:uncharacterized membrane protein